jgi:hypothetical protein
MKKVMFLVLEGCSRCKALKNKLDYFHNSFKFYSCDGQDDLCDQAENLAGVETYPMAILLDTNNSIKEIVYFTDDYNKVGKKEQVTEGVTKIGVYSVDQLVEYIIK